MVEDQTMEPSGLSLPKASQHNELSFLVEMIFILNFINSFGETQPWLVVQILNQ